MRRRLLVVEQQADAPAGHLEAWAATRGLDVVTVRAPEVGRWPDPGEFAAIAVLGSDRSVHASPDRWIGEQVAFVRAAHARRVPVLGICFGAQVLAAAIGGSVRRAPRPEIGWVEVEREPGGVVPDGPWFAWHEDAVDVPAQARVLARNTAGIQTFNLDLSFGVQFHPEVTPAIVADWVEGGREALTEARIDPAELRARTAAEAPGAGDRAHALFDAVADAWSLPPLASQ